MRRIILASGNNGKIREIRRLFSDMPMEILSLSDVNYSEEIIEDGKDFQENAFKKAYQVFSRFRLPVIADDSGLMIDKLGLRPGVFSARYAGENCSYEDNNKKVISELKDLSPPFVARFLCCALYYDGRHKLMSEGILSGVITLHPRGEEGFGYDPIFIPDGYEMTLAEFPLELKNRISHRGKAFEGLKSQLKGLLGNDNLDYSESRGI